jgi:23S rRNA G2445 N2-methylase RlmL
LADIWVLFKTIDGLEKIASQEVFEKLGANRLVPSPYGSRGWIKGEIGDQRVSDIKRLRSVVEAHIILREEEYGKMFSIDRFADRTVEAFSTYAPHARKISVSAYSVRGRPSQREIQGAFSKRIVDKLNAECNFRGYDSALRITLLKSTAVATINLEIKPGNILGKVVTHPTPLLPPIAYCMIRLCSPQAGERLLDPMCGCGTIPMMAALEWKDIKVIGADVEQEYVSCARKNADILGLQNKSKFLVSDVVELADKGIKADIMAVNPPYGIAVPSKKEVDKLYRILFEEAFKILPSRGRMVTVTPYPEIVVQAATSQMFRIDLVYAIQEKELPRTIHLMRRIK